MPTSREMRALAMRRMTTGALLASMAGFALVFMLNVLADSALRRFGLSQGWLSEMPVLDMFDQIGVTLQPAQEKALASLTIPQTTPYYMVCNALLDAVWSGGILAFGCAVLSISVMRGAAAAFQVFSGFRWPLRTAALGVLRVLLTVLWTLLLIVPGICASYSYRMSFYLLADHPDWSPLKAIAESKRLMHGHRWRLACLDFSFIGWFLLVVATFGLAGLFVLPYFATANAAFYENLLDRTGN